MSRGGTGARPTRRPLVVVAGEDGNDRKSLRILLEAHCPDMRGRIVEIKDTIRLRQASSATLADRAHTLARKVNARAVREGAEVACVFIHEDLDGVDGTDYPTTRKRVQQALDSSLPSSHYVLAVWEIEAWLLLFPQALAAVVSGWKLPAKYQNKDTGRLTDPKHILSKECGGGKRRYVESDAPVIFEKVVTMQAQASPHGRNRSYDHFREQAQECCAQHLQQRKRK